MTLGSGNHTYELVPDWIKVPDNIKLGFMHGLGVDSQNRVYIFMQSINAICVFDEDGSFIKTWNHGFEKGAHGLTVVKEPEGDFLWLAEYLIPQVCKTTLDGEIILSLPIPPLPEIYPLPRKYIPTNIAVAPNGDIYVADGYGQWYIHRFDKNGNYISSFGGKGTKPGKFNCPHGIIVDTRGPEPILLIADRANVRLQTFTLDGKPLSIFGTENLRHPCHFDIRNGDLLIPDLHGRVTILNAKNELITHLGDNPGIEKTEGWPNLPKETWQPGKFIAPHSACWDGNGDMYVTEWIRIGRITKLRHMI
jgi:DNA-binding beta-propeller fold protein YncE